MKLFPEGSGSKCGLLNNLVSKSNKEFLYNIPENTISGNIQTLIDCQVDSDWASRRGTPYFTMYLHQNLIKISNVSITRRNNYAYPNISSIEGYEKDRWVKVCNLSVAFNSKRETRVYPCKSNKYFSLFRLSQQRSSGSYDYLEIDLFGELIHYSEYRRVSFRKCSRTNIFLISMSVLLISQK